MGAPLNHMEQSWDANPSLLGLKAHAPSARPLPPILGRIHFIQGDRLEPSAKKGAIIFSGAKLCVMWLLERSG